MIEVETILKCGSCMSIVKRYHSGFDGNVPDSDEPYRCFVCNAKFGWEHDGKDDINFKIQEAWETLKLWKEKNKPKSPWDKISPLGITIRVKPWNVN